MFLPPPLTPETHRLAALRIFRTLYRQNVPDSKAPSVTMGLGARRTGCMWTKRSQRKTPVICTLPFKRASRKKIVEVSEANAN